MSCNSFKRAPGDFRSRSKVLPSPRDAIEPLSPVFSHPALPTVFGTPRSGKRKYVEQAQDGYQRTHFGTGDETESEGESQIPLAGESLYSGPNGNHLHVQGSPIDALATIALATSPTFASQSHRASFSHAADVFPAQWSPRTYSVKHPAEELGSMRQRPSKRARSEVIPPSQISHNSLRPSSSHMPLYQHIAGVEHRADNTGRPYSSYEYSPQLFDGGAIGKQVSDAELLLSFARGNKQPPSSRVGINGHVQAGGHAIDHTNNEVLVGDSVLVNGNSAGLLATWSTQQTRSAQNVDGIPSENGSEEAATSTDGLQTSSSGAAKFQTHTPPEDLAHPTLLVVNNEMKLEEVQSGRPSGKRKGRRGRGRPSKAATKVSAARKQRAATASSNSKNAAHPFHSPQSLPESAPIMATSKADLLGRDGSRLYSIDSRLQRLSKSAPPTRRNSFSDDTIRQQGKIFASREQTRHSSAPPTLARLGRKMSGNAMGRANAPRAASLSKKKTVCGGCHFSPNSSTRENESWISCNGCKEWFHFACAGFKNEREVRSVDKYFCRGCKPKHGPTTFVRKSLRAHAAVDYAGLNEGVLRTNDENPAHHYIEPIKNGTLTFLPDKFPRMRPELVTAEYFERCGAITEPIVIPAALNPRPELPGMTPRMPTAAELGFGTKMDGNTPGPEDAEEQYEEGYAPDDGQDGLDMVIPHGLTVRRVSELYGPEEKVEVIEVKSQEGSDKRWNMKKWADYYESEGDKVVRNVISLEVSSSKLGRLIRRPKVVRDLDLQDSVWPQEELAKGNYPRVQFYCLMSVADCYTDFHIDFGGSSVYYHIVKGKKTFFFIPPKKQNLKKYEEWCLSPAQNYTFLPDQVKECYRVDLAEGDTMLIPSGWIHAVWTPENSLVIGGNYLTRMHYAMQIRIAEIEKHTKVARKFRYPHFQKILWYAVLQYLEEDPLPPTVAQMFQDGKQFHREKPLYLEINKFGHNSDPGAENYNARYYSQAELDGLPDLARYIFRTVMISLGRVEGITAEVRNAVTRSIPKVRNEPSEVVRTFAMWAAWKRGNEDIPQWAHPDAVLPEGGVENGERKLSAAALKRLERQAAIEAKKGTPGRQSARQRSKAVEAQNASPVKALALGQEVPSASHGEPINTEQTPILGPRRIACDDCRKRRIRCKHKDGFIVDQNGPHSISGEPKVNDAAVTSHCDSQAGSSVTNHSLSVSDIHNWPSHSAFAVVVDNHHSANSTHPENSVPAMGQLDGYLSDPSPNTQPSKPIAAISKEQTVDSPHGKKSRAKACLDCRRSKRRCIHDEFGKVDPVKASEQPVPRGTSSKRRRSSEERDPRPEVKATKLESPGATIHAPERRPSPNLIRSEVHSTLIEPSSPLSLVPEAYVHDADNELVNEAQPQQAEPEKPQSQSNLNEAEGPVEPLATSIDQSNDVIAPPESPTPNEPDPEMSQPHMAESSAVREELEISERDPSNVNSAEPLVNGTSSARLSEANPANSPGEDKENPVKDDSSDISRRFTSPPPDTEVLQVQPQPQAQPQVTPKSESPASVRHTTRQSKPVERFSPQVYENKRFPSNKKTTPAKNGSPNVQASPRNGPSSRRKTLEARPSPTTVVRQPPNRVRKKEESSPAVVSQDDVTEDASLRLVRLLASSEFGLRRRS